MSLTCFIISGTLFFSDGIYQFQPAAFSKEANSEHVSVRSVGRHNYRGYTISEQHQLRMGTDEWITDCVLNATMLPDPYVGGEARAYIPHNSDIDRWERTGIDD